MTLIPLGFWAASGGGAGGSAFDLLETTILSSSASSVTFSGLGAYSDYKHLQIRMAVKTVAAGGNVYVRFNSDTGSNYAWHYLRGSGSSVTSGASTSRTSIIASETIGGSGTSADIASPKVIDILDFSNTSKNKTVRTLGGYHGTNTYGTFSEIGLESGLWLSTNAITSITILHENTSYDSGSRFSLYGVK